MDAGNNSSASLPATLTALVSDRFLLNDQDEDDDDKKSMGSIGSDELVCIVNPNNYTLEYDDFADGTVEVSAFDPDVIVEENGKNDVRKSREDLKRGVQDGSHSIHETHVMSELVLAVRDKKQSKKLQKEKTVKSQQLSSRSSLYNRLFRRSSDQSVNVKSANLDSSSDSDDTESGRRPLNHSDDE